MELTVKIDGNSTTLNSLNFNSDLIPAFFSSIRKLSIPFTLVHSSLLCLGGYQIYFAEQKRAFEHGPEMPWNRNVG